MSDHLPAESVTLPARGWRIDPRHALIAASVCWTGFAAMVLFVLDGGSMSFDEAGLRLFRTGIDLQPRGAPWLAEAVRDYTALGGVLLRNIIAVGALVALLFLRLRREAMLLALTIAGGWIINSAIKLLVGRPRPEVVPHLMKAGGMSFPSGHSFNSAVVYISIALAFAALSPRHSVRATLVLSAMALTLLIALSRVWLGVHYPSDAVAGWLGGAGWAFTASALLYRPAKAAADSDLAETLDPTTTG
jgi:undecaprenyl-diphosphatase